MSHSINIGIDFDNTLATYDELLQRLAVESGLIQPSTQMSKREVRNAVRNLPDGEVEWQKLQGLMYGPRMLEARLSPDVREFFKTCRRHGANLCIVSHKTEFAYYDDTRTNLRQAAMKWMSNNGFFDPTELDLSRDDVSFVETRQEKIIRIKQLGCTHFIDDLEEVFQERAFPPQVQKILFAPHDCDYFGKRVKVAASWKEIADCIFPEPAPDLSSPNLSPNKNGSRKWHTVL